MRFFILLLSGVALAHFSGLLKIWKFGVGNFYRNIHYLVICVHSKNIFSVIANLPSLQHNVGSIIKVSFVSQRSGPKLGRLTSELLTVFLATASSSKETNSSFESKIEKIKVGFQVDFNGVMISGHLENWFKDT